VEPELTNRGYVIGPILLRQKARASLALNAARRDVPIRSCLKIAGGFAVGFCRYGERPADTAGSVEKQAHDSPLALTHEGATETDGDPFELFPMGPPPMTDAMPKSGSWLLYSLQPSLRLHYSLYGSH
jgi:hypothetical protein